MNFEDITIGKTEVRYGTGNTQYVVMSPPDTQNFVLLKQTTGLGVGRYCLAALKALTPAPVKYPFGYQLVYATNMGQMRTRAKAMRPLGARVPIAVKVHLDDGGTITIPWLDWTRTEQEHWEHSDVLRFDDPEEDEDEEDDDIPLPKRRSRNPNRRW